MRQGNGSDLLGANDPRSATIGIIYVAPNDDRESVLAAILTQERLGRQQIAIVLPGQNKAFQRPVDFDGLKNMRRKLKASIIIVAPHGSSPAEFARQRHFTLFTSLENYGKSLRDENAASRATKRGWPFGHQPKLQPIPDSAVPPATDKGQPPTPASDVQDQMLSPSDTIDDRPDKQPASPNAGAATLSLGLGAGAAAFAADRAMHTPDNDQPTFAGEQNDAEQISPSMHNDDNANDDLALPASPSAIVDSSLVADVPQQQDAMQPPPSAEATNVDDNVPNADIITFSPTPQSSARNSGKISVPPVVPVSNSDLGDEEAIKPIQRRRTGSKIPVVGVAAAGAGAGAAGAAMAGGNAGAGGSSPIQGNAGNLPPRHRNRGSLLLLLLALLLVGSVALCSTIAVASPSTFGSFGKTMSNIIPGSGGSSPATVTIVPKSVDEQNNYVILAITKGTPDSSKRQVQARVLTPAVETQSKTVNATNVKNFPAQAATGTLTFYNGSNVDQTVKAANAVFTVGNVQIKLNQDVTVPASTSAGVPGTADASAYADPPGSNGNIGAGAINQFCCGSSTISVKNNNAFSGGQDAYTKTFVQQSDIDNAANPLKGPLKQAALNSPNLKKQPGEQFLDSQPTCMTTVNSDHQAGDEAQTVTVTVSVKCTGEVYDQAGAQVIAAELLKQKAAKDLGSDYILVGNVLTKQLSATVDPKGNVTLLVKAEGIWVFQFTNAVKAHLAQLIAGKDTKTAGTLLQQQPGVGSVSKIDISGGGSTLPTDPKQITIVVQPVPGLQGTPIGVPGPGTPSSSPAVTPTRKPTSSPTVIPGS